MKGLDTIQRYARAEKAAGYAGQETRQMMLARHVMRACSLWHYERNPY